MDAEELADRPEPLTAERLTELAPVLPAGAIVLGGLPSSVAAGPRDAGSDCVIVVYAQEDHTIHHATVCGSGTHFEITDDHVTGHW